MSTPFVDATMPDGSRLHVVIPDMIRTGLLTCVDQNDSLLTCRNIVDSN